MNELPTIADHACAVATRVFEEHGCDGQSNRMLRELRKVFRSELPAARVHPATPVLMFLKDMSRARLFDEWHHDHGDVLWFRLPICEPPYFGSPLDCGYIIETHGPRGMIARGNVGGWPFRGDDEPALRWVPVPVPELMLERMPDPEPPLPDVQLANGGACS